jgi:hypothetical protein
VASLLSSIPIVFMAASRKYELMNWLAERGLPARIARRVLQEWGEALGVTLYPTDYELLDNHFKVTKV